MSTAFTDDDFHWRAINDFSVDKSNEIELNQLNSTITCTLPHARTHIQTNSHTHASPLPISLFRPLILSPIPSSSHINPLINTPIRTIRSQLNPISNGEQRLTSWLPIQPDRRGADHVLPPEEGLDFDFTSRAIAEVDLNKSEPWQLPGRAKMGIDLENWGLKSDDEKKEKSSDGGGGEWKKIVHSMLPLHVQEMSASSRCTPSERIPRRRLPPAR